MWRMSKAKELVYVVSSPSSPTHHFLNVETNDETAYGRRQKRALFSQRLGVILQAVPNCGD